MKRLFLLSLLLPVLSHAAPPAVQLLVELRWVDSALPPSAQAGVRDGAVVVGTAGSVSPRGPGVRRDPRRRAPLALGAGDGAMSPRGERR